MEELVPAAHPNPPTNLTVNALQEEFAHLQSRMAQLRIAASRVDATPTQLDQLGLSIETLSHEAGRTQVTLAFRMEQEINALNAEKKLSTGRSPFRSVKDRLSQVLHISPGEVQQRLNTAHGVMAVETPDGDTETAHPFVATAFEDAALPVALAAKIIGAVDGLQAPIQQISSDPVEAKVLSERIEASLVKAALSSTPKAVEREKRNWENKINAAGVQPTFEVKRDFQGAYYQGKRFGLHKWSFLMDAIQHETFLTAIAPEANPRSANHDPAGELSGNRRQGQGRGQGRGQGHGQESEVDEIPVALDQNGKEIEAPKDTRSLAQKRLDGAIHALTVGLQTGKLSINGGYQPQIVVNIDQKTLEADLAATDANFRSDAVHSGPINPRSIRQLACNAELLPVVLGGDSQAIDVGSRKRLFTAEQRKVLYARDRGCTFPGCTSGVDRCEAHHVQEYSRGGPTTLENAAMVCRHHHHLVHETGWTITVRNGVPFWSPPPEESSSNQLMRNAYFHPEKAGQLQITA